jgi:putative FmdB family regulatory protein
MHRSMAGTVEEKEMPIYEYACEKCQHQFEALCFASDASPPACPECGGTRVRKLLSAGAIRPNGIPTGAGGFTPPACISRGAGGG